jgi:hypothetical protein
MTSSLDGRRIVLTGAGSGIGLATARLLAQHGARLALIARSRDGLEAAASAVTTAGYVAAKHAVRGFLGSLRVELRNRRSRVEVCMVHPGFIGTPFFDHAPARGRRARIPCARCTVRRTSPRRSSPVSDIPAPRSTSAEARRCSTSSPGSRGRSRISCSRATGSPVSAVRSPPRGPGSCGSRQAAARPPAPCADVAAYGRPSVSPPQPRSMPPTPCPACVGWSGSSAELAPRTPS